MYLLKFFKRFGLLLVVGSSFSLQSFGEGQLPLQARLSIEDKAVPLHGLVRARVEISNEDAEHGYIVYFGPSGELAFTVAVRRPDGTVATFRKEIPPGLSSTGKEKIEPSGAYTQELILNRWYDFPKPGTYDVTVTMNARVTEGTVSLNSLTTGGRALSASVSQQVVISPSDDEYLRNVCQELLDTIRSAPSYEDVSRAAYELNAIHDPIAATYLTQAAEARPPVAWLLISGLESLGARARLMGCLNWREAGTLKRPCSRRVPLNESR